MCDAARTRLARAFDGALGYMLYDAGEKDAFVEISEDTARTMKEDERFLSVEEYPDGFPPQLIRDNEVGCMVLVMRDEVREGPMCVKRYTVVPTQEELGEQERSPS